MVRSMRGSLFLLLYGSLDRRYPVASVNEHSRQHSDSLCGADRMDMRGFATSLRDTIA